MLNKIQINQMLMLKQAVSRDKEAIEFVIDFEKNTKSTKLELTKDKLENKVII